MNNVPQTFVQSLMNLDLNVSGLWGERNRMKGSFGKIDAGIQPSWFARNDTKSDINPSINSSEFFVFFVCAPPDENLRQISDLKFTKRNYNEALLIRESHTRAI
jgi:hypothetical protein